MIFKALGNLRSSEFILWGLHSATAKMQLVNNQWLQYESPIRAECGPPTFSGVSMCRKLQSTVSSTELLWRTSARELWEEGRGEAPETAPPVGAWVRLEDRVEAVGPDAGTLTCYCPWAFKHRLVCSGRWQRAQMKADIINMKEENDYLQQQMSPRPLLFVLSWQLLMTMQVWGIWLDVF